MSVSLPLSRRGFLAASGAVVVSFSLAAKVLAQGAPGPRLPGSLSNNQFLDSWIRIDANGDITVFTGKAELGQGIRTALIQIAAEELKVDSQRLSIVTADTGQSPDEGFTAGSQSMEYSGTALLNAAAQVREILVNLAAEKFGTPPETLRAEGGAILAQDGRRIGYGELVAARSLHEQARPQSKLSDPKSYSVIGQSMKRVDIPSKLTGGTAYVQDLRLPNMVHARIVEPPSYSAQLRSLDTSAVAKLPGVLKIMRDGRFIAVVAEREFQAVSAMRVLAASALWDEPASLPDQEQIYSALQQLPSNDSAIVDRNMNAGDAPRVFEATYHRPFHMHGSIGPACAVALYQDDGLTVWTHAQGMFPLRKSLAELMRMPEDKIRCIHTEGSGCYGHNAADDAAADVALIARAMPGRPVRLQWMREQEHGWEPYGAAMIGKVRAGLDADGTILHWSYDVWSNTHSMRPGGAGALMAGWHLEQPFPVIAPQVIPQPAGGGDRNSIPLYKIPSMRVMHRFIPSMPIRVSALRGLGAYTNVFAIESFMDELARAAGADPVQFRLKHLEDPRAREVISLAAERFGWEAAAKLGLGKGRGFAFARYKNLAAYAAIALEVEVERETGAIQIGRVVAAVDSGQAVNPDGIRNQIEGAIVQSASWTLYESVTFDRTRVTSRDWSSYPILRFPELPQSVEVHVIDRPGRPFLGTGEAGQGPMAAAIANAVAQATGARIRELPLSRARVKAVIGV
jgi:nicotinate dehydrogenase subunit B